MQKKLTQKAKLNVVKAYAAIHPSGNVPVFNANGFGIGFAYANGSFRRSPVFGAACLIGRGVYTITERAEIVNIVQMQRRRK